MYRLILTREIALGNGTRPRGTILATCAGAEPDDWRVGAWDLTRADQLSELPGTVDLAEGVEACEVLCALRNPHLSELEPVDEPLYEPAEALADAMPEDPPKRSRKR